jgi:hypothetical protein
MYVCIMYGYVYVKYKQIISEFMKPNLYTSYNVHNYATVSFGIPEELSQIFVS